MRWIVAWDSAAQGAWNTAVLIGLAAAVASWRAMPRHAFGRGGTGRWWVLCMTVAVNGAIAGFWVPVGAVVWFAYWRPRLRRRSAPVVSVVSTPGRPPLGVPGEPLI